MNINHLVVAGRLGGDPELKNTQSGQAVASFSVAVNRYWTDKNTNEKKEATEWIRCVAWGKTASTIAQYFHKGKEIYLEGRIQTRDWQDQSGQKRYTTEMVVDRFQFVGSAQDGGGSSAPAPQAPPAGQDVGGEVDIDSIPF